MAPTGRVGLGRMDAALDAMRPMEFPEDVVRDKIRQLLKVYGGDEGWAFIEEASYKVLLDSILEPKEESEEGEEHCDEAESQEEQCGEAESQGDHYFTEVLLEFSGSRVGWGNCTPQRLFRHFEMPGHPCQQDVANEKTVQEAGVKDHPRNSHSRLVHSPCCSISQPPVDNIRGLTKDGTPRAERNQPNRSPSPLDIHDVHSASIKATPPVSSPKQRKRRPCYGWISSGDEQEILTLS